MKTCHYDGPETWAPCEYENELTCKNCAYYWDDSDFEIEEDEEP